MFDVYIDEEDTYHGVEAWSSATTNESLTACLLACLLSRELQAVARRCSSNAADTE